MTESGTPRREMRSGQNTIISMTFMEGRKKTKNPRIIVCPACSTRGRINYSHPNKNKMVSDFVVY